jgi:hypothetical protein
MAILAGYVSDKLIIKNILSRKVVRKLFNGVGNDIILIEKKNMINNNYYFININK